MFSLGDVVQLKSGSPSMTVEAFDGEPDENQTVYVRWHENGKFVKESFPAYMLEKESGPMFG